MRSREASTVVVLLVLLVLLVPVVAAADVIFFKLKLLEFIAFWILGVEMWCFMLIEIMRCVSFAFSWGNIVILVRWVLINTDGESFLVAACNTEAKWNGCCCCCGDDIIGKVFGSCAILVNWSDFCNGTIKLCGSWLEEPVPSCTCMLTFGSQIIPIAIIRQSYSYDCRIEREFWVVHHSSCFWQLGIIPELGYVAIIGKY